MEFRSNRLGEALKLAKLDALIAAAPENAVYLSGAYNPVRKLLPERPAIVLWPQDGSPLLIAAAIEEEFLRERSVISDRLLYRGKAEAAVSLLAKAVANAKLSKARIGVDLEGISAHLFQELVRKLPNARFDNATALVAELRAVKSGGEVQALREAAVSTDCAEWKALDAFRVGWTEKELAVELRQALISEGAETIAFLILGGGRRGVAAHAAPSSTPLAPGEILRFDMGGFFDGWASDLAKTACVEEPSPRQRHVYRTLRRILDDHIGRIRPGRTAGELFDAVSSDFHSAKLRFDAPHVGHGIGLSVHEWPILSAGNRSPIRSDMALCAELIYVEEDRERYHLEELVLVRQDGAEVISRSRIAEEDIPVIR
ncbi:MAG: aminopeptidase P family protein [Desulfobacteraceae bacterium]|nr:MAG: aminopeptidase P family protein [Desulfobacteraceae bacterium]